MAVEIIHSIKHRVSVVLEFVSFHTHLHAHGIDNILPSRT